MRTAIQHLLAAMLIAAPAFLTQTLPVAGAGTELAHSWDAGERLPKGDLTGLVRLRFLTTLDYPPFNYLDSANHLSGFNVDLARALCDVLEISDRCQIQAMPWEELQPSLRNGQGEAIISGVAASETARRNMIFSRAYLRMAARFATNKKTPLAPPRGGGFGADVIGVAAGSAHEKMLRAYFPKAKVKSIAGSDLLYKDLREGKVAAVFADAMALSFWLQGKASEDCCAFSGEVYYSDAFLGSGMRIALKQEDAGLMQSVNFALKAVQESGVVDELYLKYFPVGFY
jgi:polar amino acid transport system substrate-binding protein